MDGIDRHGARWRARWRQDGSRRSRTFETEEEARSFLATVHEALDEERANAERRRSGRLTVCDVVDAYYCRRRNGLELSTQHHYEQLIAKHIVPKIGDLPARRLTDDPHLVQDFYDSLPRTTARHVHQILRPAFEQAVHRSQLERNPCNIAKPIRPRRKPKLIPLREEVAKIVAGSEDRDPTFGLFVWIVARLGLRRGEACALRWENLDLERGEVHVRLAVARCKGGTYIKSPKSGEERTLHMSRAFFDHLEAYRKPSGWLFPRAYNAPYTTGNGVAPHSTAGRLLVWLADKGGSVACERGHAGTKAAHALGLGTYSASPMLRWLDERGCIERTMKPRHIYRIALTDLGRAELDRCANATAEGMPIFPTTADQHFRALMRDLGMPYTLHSLRHFVATHLYNRMRDWVQLQKFLGHTNAAITMSLYANHVIEVTQLELGEAAMDLFEDTHITFGRDA